MIRKNPNRLHRALDRMRADGFRPVFDRDGLKRAVEVCSVRGTLQITGFGTVEVRVPLGCVRLTRSFLRDTVPISMFCNVRLLSAKDHFTLWRVQWLDDSDRLARSKNDTDEELRRLLNPENGEMFCGGHPAIRADWGNE